jgi:hypothetical protein
MSSVASPAEGRDRRERAFSSTTNHYSMWPSDRCMSSITCISDSIQSSLGHRLARHEV